MSEEEENIYSNFEAWLENDAKKQELTEVMRAREDKSGLLLKMMRTQEDPLLKLLPVQHGAIKKSLIRARINRPLAEMVNLR